MINYPSIDKVYKVNHVLLVILYMVNHAVLCYNMYQRKEVNRVAPSEAKKRANKKYQAKTIASLACRVKKEQAEKFKAYCEDLGKTSNAVLKDYVLDCIGEQSSDEN